MSAHKGIWRSFRLPTAFYGNAQGRESGVPKVIWVQGATWLFYGLVILFHISSKLPFIFPVGNGSPLPFSLWVLIPVLCKSLFLPLPSSAH